MYFVSVGMNAASVGDEFHMLLKRFTPSNNSKKKEKNEKKNMEKIGRIKKSSSIHVKLLNPNKNRSFVFFSEKKKRLHDFGNSESACFPLSKAIPKVPLC